MLEQDKYSGLAAWLNTRLEDWKQHRTQNYDAKFDEYYRIWRGIWVEKDKMRESENSRLISPATQQAVEATVSELEESTPGS